MRAQSFLQLPQASAAVAAVLLFVSAPPSAAGNDGPPSVPASQLYGQFCSTCHDHPKERIPARDIIARRTPDEVMQILTNGVMRAQAAGLNMNDRVAVATFVTGKAPTGNLVKVPETNLCTEHGVAKDSKMETFAAVRLEIDSWRWRGVPFYLRAGKCLPVTCTEVLAKFKLPPAVISASKLIQNHLRFRISPDVDIALGMTVMTPGEAMVGESAEMLAHHHPEATEIDAYERVLGDAMAGDASIFARQDYVEEAWRIVDPILKLATPAYEYEPGTWGPKEVATHIAPPNGWENPVIGGPASAATAGSFK